MESKLKLNVKAIRNDFPGLGTGIYFDNAATTQKPLSVLNAVMHYNQTIHANPHRGVYRNSILATQAYETVRSQVQRFIGARSNHEIVFTRGATEAINLVARSFSENFIQPGDEIVLSVAEHHSNLLPWQWLAKARGATLTYLYPDKEGKLSIKGIEEVLTKKTKLVCISHVSNVLGTIFPVREICHIAHEKGALVLVDGAQSIPHLPVNVTDLGADFFVFSGHKMYAPTGIGVLYGKRELLEKMPPFLFGGNMIDHVTEESSTFASPPYKFEAGTQNIEGVIGLGEAITYIENLKMVEVEKYEKELTDYALSRMKALDFVCIQGSMEAEERSSVISFTVEGVHPHDVATIMDAQGISVRAGHHCAQPLMRFMGLPATNRISFSLYNTLDEVDYFIDQLKTVRKWLGYGS